MLVDYGSYTLVLVAVGFLSSIYLKIRHSPTIKDFLLKFIKFLAVEIILLVIVISFFNFPPAIVFLGLLLALTIFIMLLASTFSNELLPVINERTLVVYTVLFWAVYFSNEFVKVIVSGIVSIFVLVLISPLISLSGQQLPADGQFILLIAEVTLLLISIVFLFLSLREHWFSSRLGSLAFYWFLFVLFSLSLSQLFSFMGKTQSPPSDVFGFMEWSVWSLSLGAVLASFFLFGWYLMPKKGVSIENLFANRYSNEQFRPSGLLLVILVVAGSLLINHYLAVVSTYLLINMWAVFESYLFRPYLPWGKKITK